MGTSYVGMRLSKSMRVLLLLSFLFLNVTYAQNYHEPAQTYQPDYEDYAQYRAKRSNSNLYKWQMANMMKRALDPAELANPYYIRRLKSKLKGQNGSGHAVRNS